MKLTRQGVRDLNDIGLRSKKVYAEVPIYAMCSHQRMRQNGKHYYCPECKLTWDDNYFHRR